MSDSEWTRLILEEMKRHDVKHRDLMGEITKIRDTQIDQGQTLIRNTVSLEEHIRRTNLLETKMTHVEVEVSGLKSFTSRIEFIGGIVKPTKAKIKWLIILSTILSGSVTLSDKKNMDKILDLLFAEDSITKEAPKDSK